MKVRTGASYIYEPVSWDRFDPKTTLKGGETVTVVHAYGCPPPNTMGHCHIDHNGEFAGLVCTASLQPVKRRAKSEKVKA
jgi:hypothetical protein